MFGVRRMFLLVALAVVASGAAAQSVYLVLVSDMAKNESYEVMTREEVAALKKAIAEEVKVFPKALAAVEEEWKANELTKKDYFPASKLTPRKMREQGPFPREQAQKKREALNERLLDSRFKDIGKQKKGKKTEAEIRKEEKETQRDQSLLAAQEKMDAKMKELLGRDVPKCGF